MQHKIKPIKRDSIKHHKALRQLHHDCYLNNKPPDTIVTSRVDTIRDRDTFFFVEGFQAGIAHARTEIKTWPK